MGLAGEREGRARIGFGAAATLLLSAGWTVLVLAPENSGAGLLGDALLLAALVPTGFVLFLLPGGPDRNAGVGRTVVDGLIVATAVFTIAWVVGLDDRFSAAGTPTSTIAVLHICGFVVLAATAVVMATRARPDARRAFLGGAVALSALAMADAAALVLRMADGTTPPWPMVVALASVGLGALMVATAHGSDPGLPTRASVFIPSVPLIAGLVALGAEAVFVGGLSDLLIGVGILLVVLVIARQIFALLENIAFWRDLESTIAEQTDELTRSEARFRSLVQNSSDVITVVGPDGDVTYQSPSIERVFGHGPADVVTGGLEVLIDEVDLEATRRALDDLAPGDTRTLHCRVTTRTGRPRRVEVMASNRLDDPDVGGLVLNMRDETERHALEEQLTDLAFHDPLTGLANRALFRDRVDHALARRRPDDHLAALFIDLDDFKNVNDTLGHGIGDDLLVLVAARLRGALRPGDTIGRLGGDEFAVLLEDIDRERDAVTTAEAILATMDDPFDVHGRHLRTRASIGIAVADETVTDGDALLRNADTAMYAAKARGKGCFARFDGAMHGRVARRVALEADLRVALERGDLWVAYQPVISLRTRRLVGVEALARWTHPTLGPVGPEEFVRVAEECGLIADLGRWVLRTSLAQLRQWRDLVPDLGAFDMSVNVSASQLRQPALGAEVAGALAAAGLPASCLVLELTESLLIEGVEATIGRLTELRRAGVRVALDDFGTGYSSLSYLLRLPIDKLKIDRSFVAAMEAGSDETALVRAIITMGHVIGLEIVAEGIETDDQQRMLTEAGCDLGQGFRLGRPVAAAEILELLSADTIVTSDRSS